jgi:hypothetical protein
MSKFTSRVRTTAAPLWDKVDLVKIKQQFGAKALQKNGPHDWMMDSQTILPGKTVPSGCGHV